MKYNDDFDNLRLFDLTRSSFLVEDYVRISIVDHSIIYQICAKLTVIMPHPTNKKKARIKKEKQHIISFNKISVWIESYNRFKGLKM